MEEGRRHKLASFSNGITFTPPPPARASPTPYPYTHLCTQDYETTRTILKSLDTGGTTTADQFERLVSLSATVSSGSRSYE